MANHHPDPQLKTWVLRVYIHCEGCRKKVYKILQNIDGVYKTVIDSQQHKATVTGSVTGDTLVQKLLKSGKPAEILPQKPETTNKKKQSNKKKPDDDDDKPPVLLEEQEEEAEPKDDDGEIGQKIIVPIDTGSGQEEGEDENNPPPSGKNNKKKKNKNVSPNNETESLQPADNNNPPLEYDESPSAMNGGDKSNKEPSHFVAPNDQMVYATPHNLPPQQPPPPYFGYYPTPAYGMSYNTSYPNSEASYYTPPVYGYAQSHPSAAYNYNPPPAYYRRSAFDDDQEEDDDDEGKGYCTIM